MNTHLKPATVDEYFDRLPEQAKAHFAKIREIARAAAPDSTEVISYQMAALKRKKIVMYFAGFGDHVSIYPRSLAMEAHFGEELRPYSSGKGTVKFALDEPLPVDLIQRIAEFMASQG